MRPKKFPPWLKKGFIENENAKRFRSLLKEFNLSTVCQSAQCPNLCECFGRNHATFLILGDVCTRDCRFCGVKKGIPCPVDEGEPRRIARFLKNTPVKRAIITSVTRDDLQDGGAEQFANCVREIRKNRESSIIEVLTPDFKGSQGALKKVIEASPDIFVHNIETVPRLYESLRPQADYERSLDVLNDAKRFDSSLSVKSGIMAGLGERKEEVFEVMSDLRKRGVDTLTIGQYLRPTKDQVEVSEFVDPIIFERYKKEALDMGFREVASGPFVRSSYPLTH